MGKQNNSTRKLNKIAAAYWFAGILFFGAFLFSVFRPDLSKLTPGKGPEQTTSTPTPTGSASDISSTPSATPTATPTCTPSPTPLEPMVLNSNNEVENLVINYYMAKFEMTLEAIEPYVSNISTINIAEVKKDYSLVRSLENFKVYTLKGRAGLEYVAFVSRDMQLVTLDVPSPEFSILTIVKSEPDENGATKLLVNTDILTDEQNEFINEVLTRDNFLALYNTQLKKSFEAIKASEQMANIWYKARFSANFETFEAFKTFLEDAEFEDYLKLINSTDDGDEELEPEPPTESTEDTEATPSPVAE